MFFSISSSNWNHKITSFPGELKLAHQILQVIVQNETPSAHNMYVITVVLLNTVENTGLYERKRQRSKNPGQKQFMHET